MRKIFTSIITCCVILCLSFTSVFAATVDSQIVVPYWWQVYYQSVYANGTTTGIVPYMPNSTYGGSGTNPDTKVRGFRFGTYIEPGYELLYYFPVSTDEKYNITFYVPYQYKTNKFTITIEGNYSGTWSILNKTNVDCGKLYNTIYATTVSSGSSADSRILNYSFSDYARNGLEAVRFRFDNTASINNYIYYNFIGSEKMLDVGDQILSNMTFSGSGSSGVWTSSDVSSVVTNQLATLQYTELIYTYEKHILTSVQSLDTPYMKMATSAITRGGYKRAISSSYFYRPETYEVNKYDSLNTITLSEDGYYILLGGGTGSKDITLYSDNGDIITVKPNPPKYYTNSNAWYVYNIPKGTYTMSLGKGLSSVYPVYLGGKNNVPTDIANYAGVPSYLELLLSNISVSITEGTEESQAVNNSVDSQNGTLAGKVDEYDKLESQVNDQFNNAMDNIDLPSTNGIADFGTTALFVANQMQRVYTLHPSLQFMITISMVFGLVFVAIGVIGRRD